MRGAARGLLLLALACGDPVAGSAAEAAPCTDLTAQQDRNACISEAAAEADAQLNRVYRQLGAKLDTTGRPNLLAAERSWIAFRDRECEFRAGYDRDDLRNNGTIVPFLVGQCTLELTRERALALGRQMRCPGGDMSCAP